MKGLIHIYCGDGKGKTTAALGLVMRSCACGYRVIFTQFIKSWDTSELSILQSLENVTILRGNFPSKFSKDYTEADREAVFLENNRLFQEAVSQIEPGAKTLLVLDEIIGTLDKKLVEEQQVFNYLRNKDQDTEVVMTGRNPSEELIDIADYVSEIRKIKHPYEKGIMARKGIEF